MNARELRYSKKLLFENLERIITTDQNKIFNCCDNFVKAAISSSDYLWYNQALREYFIERKDANSILVLTHCFWCGTILPKSLRDVIINVIEKECKVEFNLSDYYESEEIPTEFFSDNWWIKRKL